MTTADLNQRAYGYGSGAAGGMYPSSATNRNNANDMGAPYGGNQHMGNDPHLGSTEYNDITSGLGNADTHIYYVFQNQLELEKNIEKIKIQLSLKTDFNLIDAFRIFNESGTGSACIQDLIHGLKDLGLEVTNDEISLFMARFDQDGDRKLRYSEFCQAFLPQDSFHASLLAKKAPMKIGKTGKR